ncbi:Monooxygenase aurF [Colletotrichum fructicola Nara gc5]|uniref:Monooxygenase aurF n=1 Tax=Colletotrichum fructicola (strain Nara gc5) TaxID=1213859 RepID=A0A7J6JC90_COLFN|nr:Monooxygenase aurF [Colletotrichum fructicola Nara gc5]KAF4883260.1 Monooxygenase aurF [Colletotrichum fructicola]
MDRGNRVAVIGMGSLGLVALKNCLEEGFEAIGFERSSYVGGLWKYTLDENKTSVLPTTIVNISKERGCFTDFQFPKDVPSQCSAKQVEDYLESYVLSYVSIRKVIIATGMNQTPNYPEIKGIQYFPGRQVHSKSFKRFIPRVNKGRPIDHTINVRFTKVQAFLEFLFPKASESFFNRVVKGLQDNNFKIRPEWNLSPAPSLKTTSPVVSDEIIPALERGDVESVAGIGKVTGDKVELTDGRVLQVDDIVYCTGYKADFSILDPKDDPANTPNPEWVASKGARGKPLPRLYKNVLSEKHPESLAFMGCVAFATGTFQLYDLAAMAIVQIWKGTSPLPSAEDIARSVDRQHAWTTALAKERNVMPAVVNGIELTAWADRAAGTGVDEYLGWGWKGLKFWFQEPRLCSLLMSGIYSPHIYRYFDGKRKKWNGARAEIERRNIKVLEKPKDT